MEKERQLLLQVAFILYTPSVSPLFTAWVKIAAHAIAKRISSPVSS
jgi:hypothetical protein